MTTMTWETGTLYNRTLTTEERAAGDEELGILKQSGITDGVKSWDTRDGDRFTIRHWATEEDANNWIAFCNTAVPGMIKHIIAPL